MNIVCYNCSDEMYCHKVGVQVSDSYPDDFYINLYAGDIYKCDGCGASVIAKFGSRRERLSDELDFDKIIFVGDGR